MWKRKEKKEKKVYPKWNLPNLTCSTNTHLLWISELNSLSEPGKEESRKEREGTVYAIIVMMTQCNNKGALKPVANLYHHKRPLDPHNMD